MASRDVGTWLPGPLLFARFAFPPNRLGLCGPETGPTLPERVRTGADPELRRIAQGFEGAYPYLELIAAENDVADPLDRPRRRGVLAGDNDLLGQVGPRAPCGLLGAVPRPAAPRVALAGGEGRSDARVHHSFHVLEILPRIGLIRGGLPPDLLGVLERCLVRPGVVTGRDETHLEVSVAPLEMVATKLRFGLPRVERLAFATGDAYGDDPAVGDLVALHWERVCGRLSPIQAARLRSVTERNLAVANTTI